MSNRPDWSFREYFQRQIDQEVEIGPDVRFNLMVCNSKNIFVFVEGSTDKRFYENTNLPFLNDPKYKVEYMFRKCTRDKELFGEEKEEGKKYVIKRIQQIRKGRGIKDFDRCWFIFDKDFDVGDIRKLNKISEEDSHQVRVTDGHSMESFFVNEKNLKLICDKYSADYDDLYQKLCDFRKEMIKFYTLKAVITRATAMNRIVDYKTRYCDITDTKELAKGKEPLLEFVFNTKDFMKISRERVKKECEAMEYALKKMRDSYFINKEMGSLKENIEIALEQSISNMRGHDLFTFLEAYFEQVKGVYLGDWPGSFYYLTNLIKDFEVTLREI